MSTVYLLPQYGMLHESKQVRYSPISPAPGMAVHTALAVSMFFTTWFIWPHEGLRFTLQDACQTSPLVR